MNWKNLKKLKTRSNKNYFNGITDVSLIVSNALAEDIGSGDITCKAVLGEGSRVKAVITLKQKNIVVCGLEVLKEVFRQIDADISVAAHVREGAFIKDSQKICTISGNAIGILKGERTA